MYKAQKNNGIILVLCLILVVVLEGISLAVMSTTITNSKAIKYSNYKMEAQQKADSIINYAYSMLVNNRSTMYLSAKAALALDPNSSSTDDLPPGTAPILSSAPTLPNGMPVTSTISNATAKQWWRTNAQQYPNAEALQALPIGTYATTTGANPTDTVAAYLIYQEGISFYYGYNTRTFKIVAYATDSTGHVAATRVKYYAWKNNCKHGLVATTPSCLPGEGRFYTGLHDPYDSYTNCLPEAYIAMNPTITTCSTAKKYAISLTPDLNYGPLIFVFCCTSETNITIIPSTICNGWW